MSKRKIISVITGSIIMFASVWKLATDKQVRTKLAKLFNVIPTPHNPGKTVPPRARETHSHSQNIFTTDQYRSITKPFLEHAIFMDGKFNSLMEHEKSQPKEDIPSEPDKKAKREASKNFRKKFTIECTGRDGDDKRSVALLREYGYDAQLVERDNKVRWGCNEPSLSENIGVVILKWADGYQETHPAGTTIRGARHNNERYINFEFIEKIPVQELTEAERIKLSEWLYEVKSGMATWVPEIKTSNNSDKKFIVVDRASGDYYVGLHTGLSGKPFVSKWRESAKIFTNRVEATEAKIIMLFNGAIDPEVMEVK